MSRDRTHDERLWRFVRGDTPPREFERWLCTSPELEAVLGPDLYMQTISARYDDAYAVDAVRAAVETFLRKRPPHACACIEMRDLQVVPMGHHRRYFHTLARVKRHGDALWWLSVYQCSACGQRWLVAAEERQNDVCCLRRMSDPEAERVIAGGPWPTDFHRYERLIRLGIEAGIVFRFVNPMEQRHTLADLARERPGIPVSELAHLLALGADTAARVAREAVRLDGVDVTFDSGAGERDAKPPRTL